MEGPLGKTANAIGTDGLVDLGKSLSGESLDGLDHLGKALGGFILNGSGQADLRKGLHDGSLSISNLLGGPDNLVGESVLVDDRDWVLLFRFNCPEDKLGLESGGGSRCAVGEGAGQ